MKVGMATSLLFANPQRIQVHRNELVSCSSIVKPWGGALEGLEIYFFMFSTFEATDFCSQM